MPSGGKREGSGRKRLALSQLTREKLLKAVKAEAKRTGETPESILARMITEPEMMMLTAKDRLAAIALYYKVIVVQESHKTVEEHVYDHRKFYIPEIRQPKEDELPRA